jgi:hypothetical protein
MIWLLYLTSPKNYDENGEIIANLEVRKIYGITTGFVFLIDSIGLIWSTCYLMRTLKREFSDSLSEESSSLKRLFWIFTVSYLLRTFLLLPQGGFYQWFKVYFSDQKAYFIVSMVYFNSFYIWDIVPLLMNFWMHH